MYIADIDRDEIRSGFLVTVSRKRLWEKEIELLMVLDDICRRHDIRWFAGYGTLLGAVRHHGFVPWDDDIDVVMLRPDYDRFCQVAMKEIQEPFYWDNWHNTGAFWLFSKIRDSRTTAWERELPLEHNQGMFIDIFPLDDAPDGVQEGRGLIAAVIDLYIAMIQPGKMNEMIAAGRNRLSEKVLRQFMAEPVLDKFADIEGVLSNHFGQTRNVNFVGFDMNNPKGANEAMPRDAFRKAVYLPFETIEVPVPVGYDEVLTRTYGDYHQFVRGAAGGCAHLGTVMSPDISYIEYGQQVKGMALPK